MSEVRHLDFLKAAAATVADEVADAKGYLVPVDPEIADYMGAFEEAAITEDDIADDGGAA